jgi:hypothetical protein
MDGEPQYRCPRCRSGPRPKDQWSTRYGIMTCGTCLNLGYIIMPERTDDQPDVRRCEKCGAAMAHYQLHGYRCPTGCLP